MKTIEEVIRQAKEIHGDKYDYSLITEYKNDREKYPIICPIHGVFYKSFNKHLHSKQGCPKCSGRFRYDTESFKEEIKGLKNMEDVTCEKLKYINNKTKVTLTCHKKDENGNEHGDFEITPGHLIAGEGCPKCRYIKSASSKRRTLEDVVSLSREIHGDKYDYSLITEYKNDRIKYPIICPVHGVFYQTFNNHIKGKQGCGKCARESNALKNRKDTEWFVNKAKEVHGNKFDYSKTKYFLSNQKVCIICPEHGEFWQTPANHLNGQQCPKCSDNETGLKLRLTTEEFIEKATSVHGDKYDYSKTNYTRNSEKVLITCRKHGDFLQDPGNHLMGNGCPKCSVTGSSIEDEVVSFLKTFMENDKIILRDRDILNKRELDIYIPSKSIAIECDGLYWHSEINADKNFHLKKTEDCLKKNIQLIHIFEDEWKNKKEIVKSVLRNILGVTTNRIFARRCVIKEVDSKICTTFLKENHLQGSCSSSVKLGLFFNDELVSVMTFGKSRHFIGNGKTEWELIRFCNKINTNVVGGASKLLNYFIKNFKPESIVTYADRRWSQGGLYEKIGFVKYNTSKPNYYYVINGARHYRFNFRKSVLVKKYGCPNDMSEHKFCLSKKWYRIYDCGCLCYIWKKEN